MGGKLLFVIQSGLEDPYRVKWGLRMALNTFIHPYGERVLDDVRVLLFGAGVGIVDPHGPYCEEFGERLLALEQAGVEVAACVSIAEQLGLVEEFESRGIELVHASAYVAERVGEGYEVMNF